MQGHSAWIAMRLVYVLVSETKQERYILGSAPEEKVRKKMVKCILFW